MISSVSASEAKTDTLPAWEAGLRGGGVALAPAVEKCPCPPPRGRGRGQPVPLGGAGPGGTFPPLPGPDAAPVDNRKRLTHRCLALPMSKAQGIRGREPALRPGPGTPPACFPVRGMFLARGAGLPRGPGGQGERGRLRAPIPLLSVDLPRERRGRRGALPPTTQVLAKPRL